MAKIFRGRQGFTLIELIIVVIIIGILASIVAPMMSSMKVKAICTEAVTAMGTIRSAVRQYYAEYDDYAIPWIDLNRHIVNPPDVIGKAFAEVGLDINDLNGAYFSSDCYSTYASASDPTHTYIQCWPINSHGRPKSTDAQNITDVPGTGYLVMYIQTGEIKQKGISKSGYPEDPNSGG